ncbi:MAG: GDSL-type esterase/lipase family protein [bacterium]|nr:GDSL-type esterase/lipase family protein [bacterium]
MPGENEKNPDIQKPAEKKPGGIGKLVGLIFLSLLFIGIAIARINQIQIIENDVFPRNTDLVYVGGYPEIVTDGPDFGTYGAEFREFLFNGHQLRIRQNGTIEKVEFYVNDLTDTDGFYITIWRKDGERYDRVGETENLIGKLTAGEINEITLDRPIGNIQEGDYYGIRLTQNGPSQPLQMTTREDVNRAKAYWFDSDPGNVGVDWENGADGVGQEGGSVPVRFSMQAPLFVFIGDSILAGYPYNRSFIEFEERNDFRSVMPYLVSDALQVTYQNLGVAGQVISEIEDRFQTDCIDLKPRVVVMIAGVNDIRRGTEEADYIASWDHILNMLDDSGIHAAIFSILPSTAGTPDEHRKRERWNALVKDMVATHGFIWIDGEKGVGVNRPDGDPGNLWDMKPEYDFDKLHYSKEGYAKLAELALDALEELGYRRHGLLF